MKTVLLVATAGFLAWAGWLTNTGLASGKQGVKIETERAALTEQLKQMNAQLDKIRQRLRNIETALAVHDVH